MFLIAYIIQCTLLNIAAIEGYTPNLLLVCAIVITFLYDEKPYGLVLGAAFGLLYDIGYGLVTGPTALSLVLVCLLVMAMRHSANIENIINMLITGICSIVVYYVTYWMFICITGIRPSLMHSVFTMLFAGVYTLLVLLVVYMILRKKIVKRRKSSHFI